MPDIIHELLALDDSALMERMGMKRKIQSFRDNLTRMSELEPEFRAKAVIDVEEELTPHVGTMNWEADDREREQEEANDPSERTGEEELRADTPEEL